MDNTIKTWLSVVLLFATHAVFAQDNLVRISGSITNQLSDSVEVSFNNNRIAYYPQQYFGHVDKKGKFTLTFPAPEGYYIQAEIKHGNKVGELILHAGDSLNLTVNAEHFDSSIHYEGTGSTVQNFVAKHTLERGRMNKYTIKVKEEISKDPADFLSGIEKDKRSEINFLERNKNGLSRSFTRFWTAFYEYYNYFFIEQYPLIHEIIRLRRMTDTIPDVNFSVVKELPYAFNDTMLQVPSYLLYLTGVFEIKLKAAGYSYIGKDAEKMKLLEDSVNVLGYKMLPDNSAEYFAAQNIYGRAKSQEAARTRSQFNKFKKHWPASEYLPVVEKQVTTAERLAPGQPAPDFDISTPEGKKMKLSDLKGKAIYLGFWAGWCKPCIGEMIRERKIKDQMKNKPLEWVYVSIDNDTTVDNIAITKFKMDGIFTNATGEWNATEVALYGVQSLPAYYLIDQDGRFATQNTPTPSQSTELISEIEKLFK